MKLNAKTLKPIGEQCLYYWVCGDFRSAELFTTRGEANENLETEHAVLFQENHSCGDVREEWLNVGEAEEYAEPIQK